jgi:hypothetical protein
MGARMAPASQRGFEADRRRVSRMGGHDTSALAEGISGTGRCQTEPDRSLVNNAARRLRQSRAKADGLTTAHGDPDHRSEMSVLHGVATALLGAGLGVQIFLSFLVAPTTFRVVDRPVAARVMEGVFPGYYGFGLATTAMALLLVLALALRQPSPLRWGAAALLGLSLAGTVYAGHVLLPETHAARLRAQTAPAGDLAPLEFSRLHRRAVAVNIGIFAAGAIALMLLLATGGPDRASGPGLASRVPSDHSEHNLPTERGF